MKSRKELLKFPENFLWGTATAAHQVEGDNTNSDWWHWEKRLKRIENSGIACDHYHLYKKDFALAKNFLNNNAHRLSIEWARIEPKEGQFNPKEINHYVSVLKELKRLKMVTVVTLHHFTNPQWFALKGGWTKPKNIKYFERYIWLCTEEFRDLIDYWIVINEPNGYVAMSFLQGFWPPQKKSLKLGLRVFLNLAKAHKKAYRIIHKNVPDSKVSSSIHTIFFKHKNTLTKTMAYLSSFIVNRSFLSLTKGANDFAAINYYAMHLSELKDLFIKRPRPADAEKIILGKRNDLGWPIYPQGIYEVVKEVWERYHLPILITENGVAYKNDSKRARYIIDHLFWIERAIEEGVNVKGYIHWTLMDNFEWRLGRKAKFGLFETKYSNLERVPRKSAYIYGKICKDNAIIV